MNGSTGNNKNNTECLQMKLEITNNAKIGNRERTAMSQQQLVNTLLAEKQAVQPQPQNIQPIQPIQSWGGKK